MSEWPSLSRFQILRHLGKGGSGDVYLAFDRKLKHEVALKVVRLSSAPNSMLPLERPGALFQQKLSEICPQVPVVFDFGDENEHFWISMEYVDGVDLADELRKAPLPVNRAIHIAVQLCELLMKMHEFPDKVGGQRKLGVIHGDIKPGNIRLQSDDRVRVIDFGISKQLTLFRATTETRFGTLPYTPPERLRKNSLNRASDLWAVGVVLYEMISGSSPFRGSTKEEVEKEILAGNILPLPPDKPEDLRWIINTCLYPKPNKRFVSAADLREELLQVQKNLSLRQTIESYRSDPDASDTPTPLLLAPSPPREENAPLDQPRDPHETTPVRSLPREPEPLPEAVPEVKPRPMIREVPKAGPKLLSRRKIRVVHWLPPTLLVLLMGIQVPVWWRAEDLHQSILNGNSSVATAESWRQYHKVEKLDFFSYAEWKIARSADRILDLYTERDIQQMDREQWETAFRLSGAALDLDEDDPRNQARLAYCEGQLKRSEVNEKNPLLKSFGELEKYTVQEAISRFQKAAALDPGWPDPHVALASVHAYLNLDPAEMEKSISEAERLGYRNVRRFTEYRAEGYKRSGWSLAQQARSEFGWQKRRHLQEGIQHLETSLDLYLKLPQDARIAPARREAEEWLGYARRRLKLS